MKEFYLHAINYCIRKIRQKEVKFVTEAMNLYLIGIENKTLLNNQILSPQTFINVVKLGLRLEKYEWIDMFIEEKKDLLPTKFRKDTTHYALAELCYQKNEIDNAMIHLRQVSLSDIFFTLDAKMMLLKIYYDNNDIDPLYSLLTSFNVFLKRNKLISNEIRETCRNFIYFLNRILKAQQTTLVSLKEQIKETKLLTNRNWLIKAVDKLLGK